MALLGIFWSLVSPLICRTVIFKNWHRVLISLGSGDVFVKGRGCPSQLTGEIIEAWVSGLARKRDCPQGGDPCPLFPRHAGAGFVGLRFLSDRGLHFWHTDIFKQGDCHPQQFSAWINCPQSESPDGCDTVLRLEDLRPHPGRGSPFRTPSSGDLKKISW